MAVVKDAIETLKPEDGRRTLDELNMLGARLITTDEAIARGRGEQNSRRTARAVSESCRASASNRRGNCCRKRTTRKWKARFRARRRAVQKVAGNFSHCRGAHVSRLDLSLPGKSGRSHRRMQTRHRSGPRIRKSLQRHRRLPHRNGPHSMKPSRGSSAPPKRRVTTHATIPYFNLGRAYAAKGMINARVNVLTNRCASSRVTRWPAKPLESLRRMVN